MKFTDYDKIAEMDGVEKFEKSVVTPSAKQYTGRGEIGYTTEASTMTVYTVGEYEVKVAKVSTKGWIVRSYENGERLERAGYFATENDAHDTAKTMVESRLSNR